VTVAEELLVLVPLFTLCQYQVTPLGGVPRVNTVFPQLLVAVGVEGIPGDSLMFTLT
jgi:hypothetical protein